MPDSARLFTSLTSDLVASRHAEDRGAVQGRLEEALAQVNRELSSQLVVPFSITLGDEWQGLVRSPDAAFEVDFGLRRALHPLPVCSGVGVGTVSTPLRERTAEMDGPCFHRSREALERAKKRRGAATVLLSGERLLDEPANTICLLLHALGGRWTEKQFGSVMAYLDRGTESAAAEVLGVSQPTVHQSLEGAHGKVYLEARKALLRFLRSFPLEAAAGDRGRKPLGETPS